MRLKHRCSGACGFPLSSKHLLANPGWEGKRWMRLKPGSPKAIRFDSLWVVCGRILPNGQPCESSQLVLCAKGKAAMLKPSEK